MLANYLFTMKLKFLLLIPTVLLCTATFAQNTTYKNEAGFQTDNDGFLGQGSDRYYTAGNFGYFRHALKVSDSSSLQNKVLGFELGQRIYTPQTAAIPSSMYIDRPFAGYLYIGSTLNLLYKNESNLKLEVQTGFVGPHSYGKEIQDLIHSTFGFYPPDGWQYQIQDAFQFNLSAAYNRLLVRGQVVDLSLNSYANLGTGITGAGAGLQVRLGKFNQLFNSVSTSSTVTQDTKTKPLHNGEFFFYYKPLINAVVYDATIQGGLFESQTGVNEIKSTKNPVLLSQQLGADFVKNRWVIDLSAVVQTRETKEMQWTDHATHQWGSLTVLYRFGLN
jgi:lipid A 3-O-deacylase